MHQYDHIRPCHQVFCNYHQFLKKRARHLLIVIHASTTIDIWSQVLSKIYELRIIWPQQTQCWGQRNQPIFFVQVEVKLVLVFYKAIFTQKVTSAEEMIHMSNLWRMETFLWRTETFLWRTEHDKMKLMRLFCSARSNQFEQWYGRLSLRKCSTPFFIWLSITTWQSYETVPQHFTTTATFFYLYSTYCNSHKM